MPGLRHPDAHAPAACAESCWSVRWTVRLTESGLPLVGLQIQRSGVTALRVSLSSTLPIPRHQLDDVRRRLGHLGASVDDGPVEDLP